MGENLTLNNITVTNSAIGGINTGTLENLDARVTLTIGKGEDALADALREFTQAIHDTEELSSEAKNEVAEQLDFAMSQVGVEAKQRTPKGLAKSALGGIRAVVTDIGALVVL